jgi:hypothetical protein
MRKATTLLLLALALGSCKCKKEIARQTSLAQVQSAALQDHECPPKGTCSIELIRDKALDIMRDEFGSRYYKLSDSNETHVVKYLFSRGDEEVLPDSGYQEEIIFMIPSKATEVSLSDSELKNTSMLFGRFCFCRGQTGYYNVSDGALSVKKVGDAYKLDLRLKVSEVPQIVEKVTAVIK